MALNSNFRTLTADNIEGVVSTRNYLRNSFENGSTLGWTELNVALTNGIPTGTPTISSTAATSLNLGITITPLSLDKSLFVQIPFALVAGNGFISDAFTIDRMDAGKVLTISFDYEMVEGTYNFSGTLGSQTWMVYVYNDTAGGANWIQPAGFLGMNQSSGPGRVTCTFQSNVVWGQKYRVAVIASQAADGASSIAFDNFTCSRQTAPIGPVVTDWVSYTPTWTGLTVGNANQRFFYRRNGDSIQIKGNLQFGTTTSVSGKITFTLPAGLSLDNSKNPYPLTAAGFSRLGTASVYDGGVKSLIMVIQDSTSLNTLYFVGKDGTTVIDPLNNTSYAWGANDEIEVIELTVPISGWSSNVQLSDSTDTRVVSASYSFGNIGLTSTAAIAGIWGQVYDTHSAFTNANGRYTAPVSGYYRVSVLSARTSGTGNSVVLYRDGVSYQTLFAYSIAGGRCSGSITLYCNAGQYLTFGVDGAFTADMIFSVERLSGPSVIAATENVIAKYSTTAGQAITSTPATIVYATREIDSHGIVNTTNGNITIPISGKYLIGVYGSTASATWASGQQFLWQIRKNGSFSSFINQIRAQAAYTGILESVGPTYIDCLAGDVINIQAQSSTTTTLRTAAGANFFYLVRLGN